MKYLLDTNIMIDLFQAKEPLNRKVQSHHPDDLAISGFTEAEIRCGIEKSDPKYRAENDLARSLAMASFNRIYQDSSVSDTYGKIKAHLLKHKNYIPKNELDIFIAATAIAKDLVLVTSNIKDFAHIPGLKVESWA